MGSIKFPDLKNLNSQIRMNNGMATLWPGTWNIANKYIVSELRIPGWDTVELTQPEFLPIKAYMLSHTYSVEQEMAGIYNIPIVVWAVPKTLFMGQQCFEDRYKEKWNQIQTSELGKKMKEKDQLQNKSPKE